MAVSLHALTSLVLVDLGLPSFFKGSHNRKFYWFKPPRTPVRTGRVWTIGYSMTLFKGLRNQLSSLKFCKDHFESNPAVLGEAGDRRGAQGRKQFQHRTERRILEI